MKGASLTKNIVFIGGDERIAVAASLFAADGISTVLIGFDGLDKGYDDLSFSPTLSPLKAADAVVFPVPYSRDGETVNAIYSKEKLFLRDILPLIPNDARIFAGMAKDFPDKREVTDYSVRESFIKANAVPTAEVAAFLAQNELKMTVSGMRTAVIGYGYVGKALTDVLLRLGATVTVIARREAAREAASSTGAFAIDFPKLDIHGKNFDCIFNTVPSIVLDEARLRALKRDCVIIELASSPGGIDKNAAARYGIKTIGAPALPGRFTPKTAGRIIYDTLREIR